MPKVCRTIHFTAMLTDNTEYPSCAELEKRCCNMVASMFNAPVKEGEDALGVTTIGSSEAIILSVLAAKKRWQHRMREAGKDASRPNLIATAAVQVCVEKVG
jgi:glutamate decarboxylase